MAPKINEWQIWGDQDPYYGVLSGPEFRKDQLTPERLDEFFTTGENHVRFVLSRLDRYFGYIERRKILDYGCGVGRLIIPFSQHFEHAYGVDLSDGMLAEARHNLAKGRSGGGAVTLIQSDGDDLSDLPSDFDLIHSVIVFQHIPLQNGYAILEELMEKVSPNGILAIHVNIARNVGRLHNFLGSTRRFRPIHFLANILTGKPMLEPRMQMNCYSLDNIAKIMAKRNFESMIAEPYSDHQGYVAFFIFGRRKA